MVGTSSVFVIGGYTLPRGDRVGVGGLLVGYHDGDGLLHCAGLVERGFSAQDLRSLRTDLEQHRQDACPFVDPPDIQARWVEPLETCMVEFTAWTREGALEDPVYRGLRDVPPEDVRLERPADLR